MKLPLPKFTFVLITVWLFGSFPIAAQSSVSIASTGKSLDVPTKRLEHELERISKLAKAKVGICALHLESGKQISLNLQERFAMASSAIGTKPAGVDDGHQ